MAPEEAVCKLFTGTRRDMSTFFANTIQPHVSQFTRNWNAARAALRCLVVDHIYEHFSSVTASSSFCCFEISPSMARPIKGKLQLIQSLHSEQRFFDDHGMPYCIILDIMYRHDIVCFFMLLFINFVSRFLNVSTNLYKTVHYVRAIQILHFWQLLINVFLVTGGNFYFKNRDLVQKESRFCPHKSRLCVSFWALYT